MRLCCGCYQRKDPRDLIRLQIDQQGSLMPVFSRGSGRSAWVCFNTECVQAIVRHPKKIFRSLKVGVDTSDLEHKITEWLWQDICSIVQAMFADGCLSTQQKMTEHHFYITSTSFTLQEYFTEGPKYLSTSATASIQCHPIYSTSHKLLPRLLRNIHMYKFL